MGSVDANRLIGFDVRWAPTVLDPLWTDDRRFHYLLRDDVERPLSVDQHVWPSVFPEATSDDWRGVLNHWSDLGEMTIALEESRRSRSAELRYVASAIAWDLLSLQEKGDWSSHRLEATVPTSVGPDWDVLGYDIADRWLVSGLRNCGYVGREREEWRLRWSRRLNSYHLFDDPNEAHAFAKVTDERVPEHAPFFVYCLFWVPLSEQP